MTNFYKNKELYATNSNADILVYIFIFYLKKSSPQFLYLSLFQLYRIHYIIKMTRKLKHSLKKSFAAEIRGMIDLHLSNKLDMVCGCVKGILQ